VFALGWGRLVQMMLGPISTWPVQMPGAIIGVLPPILAWVGLWWAQFPADRALREQRLLLRFDNDEPIYRPPPLWSYLLANLRLQVLFTAVPILLILGLHDVIMLTLWRGFDWNVEQSAAEGLVTFISAMCVFLIVPEVLVRVLPTQTLPPSPLRDRMEAMCHAHRLKFRDVLIWKTDSRIANALVMGVIPQFRYVLLSDLLLQEMRDEQVEAVFAHELGHVVHRHMIWYLVFMKVLILVLAVIALVLEAQQKNLQLPDWMPIDLVMTLIGFTGFVVAFGYVSRRFERQADVFAARTLQRDLAPIILPDRSMPTMTAVMQRSPASDPSHVGPIGANLFSSALERVAAINNIPIGPRGRWEGGATRRLGYVVERVADAANNWLHGSISQRMRALQRMSADPSHTHRFDRYMSRLYETILLALVVSGTIAWLVQAPL
jgi:STE24 endopeptidase